MDNPLSWFAVMKICITIKAVLDDAYFCTWLSIVQKDLYSILWSILYVDIHKTIHHSSVANMRKTTTRIGPGTRWGSISKDTNTKWLIKAKCKKVSCQPIFTINYPTSFSLIRPFCIIYPRLVLPRNAIWSVGEQGATVPECLTPESTVQLVAD